MKKLLALTILIIALGSVVFASTGVISIQNTTDKTSVTIDKKELKDPAGRVLEKTGEVGSTILNKTNEVLEKAAAKSSSSGTQDKPQDPQSPNDARKDNTGEKDEGKTLLPGSGLKSQ